MPTRSAIAAHVSRWAFIAQDDIDLDFVPRNHRRRLSLTTRLALTAYHAVNRGLEPLRTVLATRYGEYQRTYAMMADITQGQSPSPAAFSVAVHNTPTGILGIATDNVAASSTTSGGVSTLEQGFIEAALQLHDTATPDIVLLMVDEPLPEAYATWQHPSDVACALALRLSAAAAGGVEVNLSWQPSPAAASLSALGTSAARLVNLANAASGTYEANDGRLNWRWQIDRA